MIESELKSIIPPHLYKNALRLDDSGKANYPTKIQRWIEINKDNYNLRDGFLIGVYASNLQYIFRIVSYVLRLNDSLCDEDIELLSQMIYVEKEYPDLIKWLEEN